MARIKIKDLPKDQKVSKEELRKIKGGDGSVRFIGNLRTLGLIQWPAGYFGTRPISGTNPIGEANPQPSP